VKPLAALGRYSKFIAAVIGAVTEAINVGVLPQSAHNDVSIVITVLTALGVYGVTNTPATNPLEDRINALESQQVALGDLQESFAAGTSAAMSQALAPVSVATGHVPVPVEVADQHFGQSGPSGVWPTAAPAALQTTSATIDLNQIADSPVLH